MADKKKVMVPVYLEPEQYRILKKLSEETDAPMAAMVRRAINDFLIKRGKMKRKGK